RTTSSNEGHPPRGSRRATAIDPGLSGDVRESFSRPLGSPAELSNRVARTAIEQVKPVRRELHQHLRPRVALERRPDDSLAPGLPDLQVQDRRISEGLRGVNVCGDRGAREAVEDY